jgi:DNA repair protein RadC
VNNQTPIEKSAAAKMKELPSHMRPREKLLAYGPARLSDQELLAILLGSGTKGESALAVAGRIMQADQGRFILDAEVAELRAFKGIGKAKACVIIAAKEFSRRLAAFAGNGKQVVSGPEDAARILQAEIGYLDREAVRVINLDSANHMIALDAVSLGGLSAAPIHPREVFKSALKRSAAGIIVGHNHPSGDLRPSGRDLEETRRLAYAGEMLGVSLLDHIIVAFGSHYSMMTDGYMTKINTAIKTIREAEGKM